MDETVSVVIRMVDKHQITTFTIEVVRAIPAHITTLPLQYASPPLDDLLCILLVEVGSELFEDPDMVVGLYQGILKTSL